jgi:hypothetical protein
VISTWPRISCSRPWSVRIGRGGASPSPAATFTAGQVRGFVELKSPVIQVDLGQPITLGLLEDDFFPDPNDPLGAQPVGCSEFAQPVTFRAGTTGFHYEVILSSVVVP